ncbi:MAG: hypothetical protein ACOZNI_37000 [Myxococcota bacterium]
MRVHVYLRQSLFVLPGDAGHIPANAAILVGTLVEQGPLGVTVKADTFKDEKGRPLQGGARTLIVPAAKIDHVWIEG